MILSDVLTAVRLELQDIASAVYSDDEVIRNINKSVSFMSRLLPHKAMLEITVGDDITAEALTVPSSETITTANKPIKSLSETVKDASGNTLVKDTDYEINYLTGVLSSITAGSYTIDYSLDRTLMDISSYLPDCIRIEKVEYPLGEFPTYGVIGDYLSVKGDASFTANEKLRIYYLERFSAPKYLTEGDYGSHLDEVIITGAVGGALYSKADYYIQQAVTGLGNVDTAITALKALTLTPPTAPSFPATVTLPADPSLTYTDAETALNAVATAIANARTFLTSGEALVNAVNAGENVGENYTRYATVEVTNAASFNNEAIGRIRELETQLAEHTSKLNRYRSAIEKYSSDISEYQQEGSIVMSEFNLLKARLTDELSSYNNMVTQYINVAERLRIKGAALLNQFFTMIGTRAEAQPISFAQANFVQPE